MCLAAPMVMLAGMTLTIGLYSEPFYDLSRQAAEQLKNVEAYRNAVLSN